MILFSYGKYTIYNEIRAPFLFIIFMNELRFAVNLVLGNHPQLLKFLYYSRKNLCSQLNWFPVLLFSRTHLEKIQNYYFFCGCKNQRF